MPEFEFDDFIVCPVQEKEAWRLCDFATKNSDRLKKYFPKTLEQHLTPDLSSFFILKKAKQFFNKKEYLFVLKERKIRTIIDLVYLKKLNSLNHQVELAYAISKTYNGKGYINKSVMTLSSWAFDQGFKTLQILINKENTPSIRLAENCGFFWKSTLLNEHKLPNGPTLNMELYKLDYEG